MNILNIFQDLFINSYLPKIAIILDIPTASYVLLNHIVQTKLRCHCSEFEFVDINHNQVVACAFKIIRNDKETRKEQRNLFLRV